MILASLWQLIQPLLSLAIGIIGVGLLITFHEFGHFLFARLFGVYVPTFSIGFGPTLASKQIGTTKFILAAIPLGGYVEVSGLAEPGQGEQKNAHSRDDQSFASKPFYQKILILCGGILFNFLFAYAVFIGLLATTGISRTGLLYPANAQSIIETVEADSAAAKAGLMPHDRIIAINDTDAADTEILIKTIQKHPNESVSMVIERNGQKKELPCVCIGERPGTTVGSLGVSFALNEITAPSFWGALTQGIQLTNELIKRTFFAFSHLFRKRSAQGMAGPVMIIAMAAKSVASGFDILLILLAIISINLAILNLIPVPILDGGQIVFVTVEAIIGRPLSERFRYYVSLTCWLFMLALFLILTVKDLMVIAQPYLAPLLKMIGMQ